MQAERIIGIKSIGLLPTIDIEVDNDNHIFYGNGIATSNSHAVSYAKLGYITAYLKKYYTIRFYKSWLNLSIDKQKPFEEINKLVNDAKLHNINIRVPTIKKPQIDFYIDNNEIYYGLGAVRGIGESQTSKIREFMANNTIESWTQFLVDLSDKLSKTTCEALIKCGALDTFKLSRKKMEFEYTKWNLLSDLEKDFGRRNRKTTDNVIDVIRRTAAPKKEGGGCHNAGRAQKLREVVDSLINPPYSMVDTAEDIHNAETYTMGVAITCNKVDGKDTIQANCNCKDILDGVKLREMAVAVTISDIQYKKIKNGPNKGKNMATLSVCDSFGAIKDLCIFEDQLNDFDNLLYKENCVILTCYRTQKGALNVKAVEQI